MRGGRLKGRAAGLTRSLVRSLRVAARAGGRHFWLLMSCQLVTAVTLLVQLGVARSLLDDVTAAASDGGHLGPLIPKIGLLAGLLLASNLAAGFEVDQRRLLADLLVHLAPEPGMRVLEVGTGTGYNAALLAHILGPEGSVVSLEIDQGLADRAAANLGAEGVRTATVVGGDGSLGSQESGPYDRIIVTVGAQTVHDEWVAQLAEGGRLVLPLDHSGSHVLTVLDRPGASERLAGYFAGWSSFVAGLAGLRLGPRVSTCTLADSRRLAPVAPLPDANDFPDFSFFAGLEHAELTTIRVVGADGELFHVGPGIVDPSGGIAALAPGSLRATADAAAADRLRATADRWDGLGRSRLRDYEVTLHGAATAPGEEPAQWTRLLGTRTEMVRLRRPAPTGDADNG